MGSSASSFVRPFPYQAASLNTAFISSPSAIAYRLLPVNAKERTHA